MKAPIILPAEARSKYAGHWIYCADGFYLPPPATPVPILLQGRHGLHYNFALWHCTIPLDETAEYSLEEILTILDSRVWSTVNGARIPRQPYAWFVVPPALLEAIINLESET